MMKHRRLILPLFVFIINAAILSQFALPAFWLPALAAPLGTGIEVINFDTDDYLESLQDLSGTEIGSGIHSGEVWCKVDDCFGRVSLTDLQIASQPLVTEIDYKFIVFQARDIATETVVAAGDGVLIVDGKKEKFMFTAVFQNNQDGTILARYEASIPEASIVILQAPGTFVYRNLP